MIHLNGKTEQSNILRFVVELENYVYKLRRLHVLSSFLQYHKCKMRMIFNFSFSVILYFTNGLRQVNFVY